jgi:hypothetical protein
MSHPWYALAEQTLDPDDNIEKTYPCIFDNKNGYLCLGTKKMVFVNVYGFLRKNYEVLLDVPYDELKEVCLTDRFKLDIVHQDETHKFETTDNTVKIILDGIEEISKTYPLNPNINFRVV